MTTRPPFAHPLAAAALALVTAWARADGAASVADLKTAAEAAKLTAEANKIDAETRVAQLPKVGDVSKYKVTAPEVKLDAYTTKLAHDETVKLAGDVADSISLAASCGNAGTTPPLLLLSSPTLRNLLIQAHTLPKALADTRLSVENLTLSLKNLIDAAEAPSPAPSALNGHAFLGGVVAVQAVAAIGEVAISLASALRADTRFSGADHQKTLSAPFDHLVLGALATKRCQVLDADALLSGSLTSDETLPELAGLTSAMDDGRRAVKKALETAGAVRKLASGPKVTKAQSAAAQETADNLDAAAKKVNGRLDEAQAAITALAASDANGRSALDDALRGKVLISSASKSTAYTLSLALNSALSDVIAKTSLLGGLRVAVGSHSVATWRLVGKDGQIKGAGSVEKHTPLAAVALPIYGSNPGQGVP